MKPNAVDKRINSRVSQTALGSPVSSVLIIGYGNPLRGDDALGPIASEELAKRYKDLPQVTVLTVHQLTLDLAETLADYDRVILIDAREAEPVGEIFLQEISPTNQLPQAFSHYLAPAELLSAAQVLYNARPEVILTGINTANFDVGASLSAAVEDQIGKLVGLIEEIISIN